MLGSARGCSVAATPFLSGEAGALGLSPGGGVLVVLAAIHLVSYEWLTVRVWTSLPHDMSEAPGGPHSRRSGYVRWRGGSAPSRLTHF